jgi:hypothetical protein
MVRRNPDGTYGTGPSRKFLSRFPVVPVRKKLRFVLGTLHDCEMLLTVSRVRLLPEQFDKRPVKRSLVLLESLHATCGFAYGTVYTGVHLRGISANVLDIDCMERARVFVIRSGACTASANAAKDNAGHAPASAKLEGSHRYRPCNRLACLGLSCHVLP